MPDDAPTFFGLIIGTIVDVAPESDDGDLLGAALRVRDAITVLSGREPAVLDALLAIGALHAGDLRADLWNAAQAHADACPDRVARACGHVRDLSEAIARIDAVIVDAKRAASAVEDGSAARTIRSLVDLLADAHPRLGLSFGYVGNCDLSGGRRDDRSWRVFARLATPSCVGACDVSFGGHATDQLGRMMVLAEKGLADWCAEQERRLDAREIRTVGERIAA